MIKYVLQGNYGSGWDDLLTYGADDKDKRRADYKCYEENEPTVPHRIVKRYVKGQAKPKTQSL